MEIFQALSAGLRAHHRPRNRLVFYMFGSNIHKLQNWWFVCRNFENTVLDAYRWLSQNYKPDDQIFLFGVHACSIESIIFLIHNKKQDSRAGHIKYECCRPWFTRFILPLHPFASYPTYSLHQVGLIHKGNEAQIPLWALWNNNQGMCSWLNYTVHLNSTRTATAATW